MSRRTPSVRDAIRVFNKYVTNPVMMRFAGRRHWYAAVICHTGRRSGKSYATPVVAEKVEGGFVIPLPYGTEVDWLRNVVHAGRATIRFQGLTFDVVEPGIIDAEAAEPRLSPERRRSFRRLRIGKYLELRLAPAAA